MNIKNFKKFAKKPCNFHIHEASDNHIANHIILLYNYYIQ